MTDRDSQVALVVCDVDGTITPNHGPSDPSPAVCEAFAAVRAAGIAVTLATGRTLDHVRRHLAGPLGLTTPVITAQGAVIGDPVTGEVLARRTIPRPHAHLLAERLDGDGWLAVLYLLDVEGATTMVEAGAPSEPAHDHLFGTPRTRVDRLLAALEGAVGEPLKFIVEAPLGPGAADPVGALRILAGAGLQVSRTHPRLVEMTAAGVDKGAGLRDLCALLGVRPAQVLAIGDNDNDVPMLREAGVAVVLADGSAAARAVADRIAPAFDDDGAAVVLRELLA